jgi:hypothetical protein
MQWRIVLRHDRPDLRHPGRRGMEAGPCMATVLAGMPQVYLNTGVPDCDEEAEPEAYKA